MLDGDCNDVVKDEETKKGFEQQFRKKVADVLGIAIKRIVVNDASCGSINVTFTVTDAKKSDVTVKL